MRRQFASRLFQNIDYLDHSEDDLDESILWPYEQYEWLFVLQGSIFPMVSRTPQAKSNYLSSRMAESPLAMIACSRHHVELFGMSLPVSCLSSPGFMLPLSLTFWPLCNVVIFSVYFSALSLTETIFNLVEAWNFEPDSVTPEDGAVSAMLRCFSACLIAALAIMNVLRVCKTFAGV